MAMSMFAQNEKKYFRPITAYKLDSVEQSGIQNEMNATGLPSTVVNGKRRKDEDLITW